MTEKFYCIAGKILWVDLTTGHCKTSPTMDHARKFLGGRGVNWYLLYNGVKTSTKPYEPDNLLIFGSGLLVGTLAPCAARFSVDSKNPFNNGVGSSNSGGHFSSELKYAGYDHLVIQGRAKKPVYICVDDKTIEIKDASTIWGKTTWDADELIKEELKDEDFQISCIGPAGENLVRSACIVTNRARAAGRCGLGAVMGSKNLKAVTVRGSGCLEVKNTEKFMELVDCAWEKIRGSQSYRELSTYGTLNDFPISNLERGSLVVRNFQDAYIDPEMAEKIRGHVYHEKYQERSFACFACPFHCSKFYRVTEGPYAPLAFEKMEANAITNFGTNLFIDYPPAILKAQSLCTEYGLDIDASTVAIAWAFECYERGILRSEDVNGLELKWGNHEVVMELLKKTAHREGFGNTLAEGVKRASEIVGKGSEEYAVHIKGMDNREFMRAVKGWALGVVVALRGGGHTTGAPGTEVREISAEVCRSIWGIEDASDPLLYVGKPELVIYFERLNAVVDSLGICLFAENWKGPDLLGPDIYARIVSAATGWEMSGKDLMLTGERIHNVGKAFNTLHAGFDRTHDYPPKRLMKDPIKSGPRKGERLEKIEWDKMLDRYYQLHGWDKRTGRQSKSSLQNLQLEDMVDDLEKADKLLNCRALKPAGSS